MNKFQKVLAVVAVSGALAGCASTGMRSDSLGLSDNEALKTYAETYQPARDLLIAGKFDELKSKIISFEKRGVKTDEKGEEVKEMTKEEAYETLMENSSELSIMERGLLALNMGEIDRALFFFDVAEEKLNLADENSTAGDHALAGVKSAVALATGASEISDYQVRGYEKVMILNYKALCYMLKGDRRAYNVTRRAIDLQQSEWEKFKQKETEFKAQKEKEAVEAQEENEKAQVAQQQEQSSQQPQGVGSFFSGLGSVFGGGNAQQTSASESLIDQKKQVYEQLDKMGVTKMDEESAKLASLVPSSYVNPFGDYMNAMMQEFDSYEDKTLRDNARISYKKVVENWGGARNLDLKVRAL